MHISKPSRATQIVVGAACAGVLAGIGGIAVATSSTDEVAPVRDSGPTALITPDSTPNWSKTLEGLTYGTQVPANTPADQLPELLVAVGQAGERGYVRTKEFLGNQTPAASPAEAVKQMNALDIDKDGHVWLHVYAGDGKTVIDRILQATISEGTER